MDKGSGWKERGVSRRGWGGGGGTLGCSSGADGWWEVGVRSGLLEKTGCPRKAPRWADSAVSMSSDSPLFCSRSGMASFWCWWVTLVHWYHPPTFLSWRLDSFELVEIF